MTFWDWKFFQSFFRHCIIFGLYWLSHTHSYTNTYSRIQVYRIPEGALVGVQGCTAPPFFEKHHIAPPNFEQSIVNAPQDHLVTILSEFPLKICTPIFKYVTCTLYDPRRYHTRAIKGRDFYSKNIFLTMHYGAFDKKFVHAHIVKIDKNYLNAPIFGRLSTFA